MKRRIWRLRSDRGAELIEFALVLPLLLLIVLGIVDFGFLFQRLEVITNAAREGARLAVLPGYSTTDVRARVRNYLVSGGVDDSGIPDSDIVVSNTTIPVSGGVTLPGKTVSVTFFHPYSFIGASMFGGSFTSVPLRGTAVMQDEAGGP